MAVPTPSPQRPNVALAGAGEDANTPANAAAATTAAASASNTPSSTTTTADSFGSHHAATTLHSLATAGAASPSSPASQRPGSSGSGIAPSSTATAASRLASSQAQGGNHAFASPPASAVSLHASNQSGPSSSSAAPAAKKPTAASTPGKSPATPASKPAPKRKPKAGSEASPAPGRGTPASDDGRSSSTPASSSKRRKANRACGACQKAHLTCDDSRPCQRCIKKGIADSCHDGTRKKAKYLLTEEELAQIKAEKERKKLGLEASSQPSVEPDATYVDAAQQPQQPGGIAGPGKLPPDLFSSLSNSTAPFVPSPPHSFGPGATFGSESASLEYSILSSMIHGIDPSLLRGSPDVGGGAGTPGSMPGGGAGMDSNGMMPQAAIGLPSMGIGGAPWRFVDANSAPMSAAPSQNSIGAAGGIPLSLPSAAQAVSAPNPIAGAQAQAQGQGQVMALPPPPGWTPSATILALPGVATSGAGSGGGAPFSAGAGPSAAAPAVVPGSQPLGDVVQPLHHMVTGAGSSTSGGGGSKDGSKGSEGFDALEVPTPVGATPSASQADKALGGSGSIHLSDEKSSSTNGGGGDSSSINQGGASGSSSNAAAGGGGAVASSSAAQAEAARATQEVAEWKERIKHVYSDKCRPFPYTEGYHFLIKHVTANFEKAEVLRIVRALAIFRPSLIALQMPLAEEDEIFVERSIQRTILEFEKLISFSGTPTVVWRRTCEICVVGVEFQMLTQRSRDSLLGRYIYEYLDKSSTLSYWEKFAAHAFENTAQSIMMPVRLLSATGEWVKCAACFSIKRDVFDLPSLVVANFLPIL